MRERGQSPRTRTCRAQAAHTRTRTHARGQAVRTHSQRALTARARALTGQRATK